MAGPSDIQRFPRGLLGLLGIQATGDTPHQLGNAVVGQLEMLPFYLNDRLTFQSFPLSAAIAAVGVLQFTGSAVPDGTVRFVYNAGVLVPATAAASSLTTRLCVFRSPGLNGETYISESLALPASTGGTMAASFDDSPMWILPGQSFGLRTSNLTGAPGTTPVMGLYFADIRI